jgi:glycosyltransferase involved in cell wall biosynthesis
MALQASIVIPTYNGAARLPFVLHALADQDVVEPSFEVVIVDNASNDGTAHLIEADPSWLKLQSRGIHCVIVTELRQGSAYARLRGAAEARAPLICFLDDDNLPASDYVRSGIEEFADKSVGMVISRVLAQWSAPPPPAIARRSWLYAITDNLGNQPIDFGATGSIAPTVTAGMWLRREALGAIASEQERDTMAGRSGDSLSCGEDIELGILIGAAGYRRIYAPRLRLEHLISADRLRLRYVCRLIEGIVRSELTVRTRYGDDRYTPVCRASGRSCGSREQP